MQTPVRMVLALACMVASTPVRAAPPEPCEPSGPLADAVAELIVQVSSSTSCADTRACPNALRSLASARLGLCRQPSRALSQLASAVQGLERAGLLSGSGDLRAAVEGAVEAASELVAEEREDLLHAIERLCSGARGSLGKNLAKAEASFALAQTQLAGDAWSLALRSLASAGSGFESAEKSRASAARRCRPRACNLPAPVQFTPGPAGNDALELVLPDRGTVARYQLEGEALDILGPFGGALALRFDGLLRARLAGALEFPELGAGFALAGTFSPRACLDANGWVHYESTSESLVLRAERSASLRGNSRTMPPAVSVPPLIFLPSAPHALALREGDRVFEPSFDLDASVAGARALLSCTASHEVVAIEERTVPAGSFETARVESRWDCVSESGPLTGTAVAWLASGVGFVEFHFTSPETGLWDYELACLEVPETAGSCGAP